MCMGHLYKNCIMHGGTRCFEPLPGISMERTLAYSLIYHMHTYVHIST